MPSIFYKGMEFRTVGDDTPQSAKTYLVQNAAQVGDVIMDCHGQSGTRGNNTCLSIKGKASYAQAIKSLVIDITTVKRIVARATFSAISGSAQQANAYLLNQELTSTIYNGTTGEISDEAIILSDKRVLDTVNEIQAGCYEYALDVSELSGDAYFALVGRNASFTLVDLWTEE